MPSNTCRTRQKELRSKYAIKPRWLLRENQCFLCQQYLPSHHQGLVFAAKQAPMLVHALKLVISWMKSDTGRRYKTYHWDFAAPMWGYPGSCQQFRVDELSQDGQGRVWLTKRRIWQQRLDQIMEDVALAMSFCHNIKASLQKNQSNWWPCCFVFQIWCSGIACPGTSTIHSAFPEVNQETLEPPTP